MKKKKEKKKIENEEIQLLITGMSDNVNLLNEDELSDLFGGYICNKNYVTCYSSYFICSEDYF